MRINNKVIKNEIHSDNLSFQVLNSGDFFAIKNLDNYISMYRATSLDGMLANIYLRISKNGKSLSTKLLGVDSPSFFRMGKKQFLYSGKFKGVNYQVHFTIKGSTWFWTVNLESEDPSLFGELFYGQDLSLNGPWNNEAYVCQYLDHQVYKNDEGYAVITKQNQGPPLMLQQGSLTPNIAYATDGFDFFGTEYKRNNKIKVLDKGDLPSRIYQYEFAYICFQTAKFSLEKPYQAIFYAHLTPNYYDTNYQVLTKEELWEYYRSIPKEKDFQKFSKEELAISWNKTYPYIPFSDVEIEKMFSDKIFLEKEKDELLSWFNKKGTHFVVGKKEDYVERAHGNIIANQAMRDIDNLFMSSTNWIYGVFNSQISFGNTQYNQMISHNKTPLNVLKVSGQRIFVKVRGDYHLLALPAIYEMDVNATTWYYKLEEDILKIEVAIAPIKNVIVLRAQSLAGNKYDFILTQVLVMGNDEYLHPLNLDIQEEQIDYFFDESTLAHQKYPELSYRTFFNTDGTYQISTDEVFYQDHKSRNNPLLSFEVNNATSFSLEIWGINKMEEVDNQQRIEDLRKDYQNIHQNAYRSFHLDISQDNENYLEIQKFNILVPWYLHNALVHYAAPHGLEQYGGGAWGTRDICQGPIELFTALGRFDLVKKIILKVYERQFIETGDWPQWFMFDAFEEIQADSSHGDIIVWPLYALSNYLINTGDKSILEIKTPYTSLSGKRVSEASIRDHVLKQIETMKRNFIPGTSLPSYGGGDWNDTLQPRHSEDRENMSSSWTTALTIQALENFLFSCPEENDIRIILNNMKKDYRQYFLKDNIPAGFVEIKDQKVKYILHPEDEVTGIKYRLLSFNQGFTAELFDELELSKYLDIIDEHLMHPDGVRLMDKTVKYQGGTPEIFMRAETATNFGREIGLQYVHAHIRYIEAMAKVGEGERLFTGLKKINPILIKDNVPNAKTRQSNVYFSSSDGDFINRYQADQHFDDLRKGKVAVKGGWRLYSSGPGIYLNQLIANFLGIKTIEDQLYIDPILPISCNGLEFEFIYKQYHLKLRYEVTRASTIEYLIINGKKIERNTNFLRYRDSGVLIPNSYLKKNNEIIVRI